MNKVMTMGKAIGKFLNKGDSLFLAGMQHGEPSAALHEIIRQQIDHLTLICCLVHTSYLLVGAGLLDKAVTAFMDRNEKRQYALIRARKINRVPLFEETSHFGICMALMAGQMGLPFLPIRSLLGSDLMTYNPNLGFVTCPFTGEKLGAVRAIVPDVGIIHVQRADAEGNAQKWGTLGVDREGINASESIIVTTEKIVSSDVIRREPNLTIIPGFRVNAVVEQPWGSYPMHLAGYYNGDIRAFMEVLKDKERFETYLSEYVYGVKDWNGYLEKQKKARGEYYFAKLKIKNPVMSDPIITGY